MSPGELADDLAVVDVAAKFEEFERGVATTELRERYEAVIAKIHDTEKPRWSFGLANPGPSTD